MHWISHHQVSVISVYWWLTLIPPFEDISRKIVYQISIAYFYNFNRVFSSVSYNTGWQHMTIKLCLNNFKKCSCWTSLYRISQEYGNLFNVPKLMYSYASLYLLYVPAIDLVSDPPIPPPTPSRGAEPSSESAAFVMPDPLLGTVFLTTSIRSMTLAFLSAV